MKDDILKQEWEVKRTSSQIADTGDYDCSTVITNGVVTIWINEDESDDEHPETDNLLKALNEADIKGIEDEKLLGLYYEEKGKNIAPNMFLQGVDPSVYTPNEKGEVKTLVQHLTTRLEFLTYDLERENKRAINPNNVIIIALEAKINELKLLITTLEQLKDIKL